MILEEGTKVTIWYYDHADDDDNGDCDDIDHNYDHVDDDEGLLESHAHC